MESCIKTFSYPDGTIQRAQLVRPDSWADLDFLEPAFSEESIGCFSHIYRKFLVPGCPWLFGRMVMPLSLLPVLCCGPRANAA